MTRISVGIPTFNRAGFLDETLESLFAQDWPELEIVIVDDGSTDDTPRVLERWTRRSSKVRVHRQANAGEAAACNEAWRRATGQLFGIVCSDDPQPSTLLHTTARFLATRPEAIVCHPNWWEIDAQGRRLRERRVDPFSLPRVLAAAENVVGPGAFIRRDRVVAALPRLRDPSFRFHSDFWCWLELAELGPFAHLPEPVAVWRAHSVGASAAHARAMAEELVTLLRRYFDRRDLPPGIRALRPRSMARARLVAAHRSWRHPGRCAQHLIATVVQTPLPELLPLASWLAQKGRARLSERWQPAPDERSAMPAP